MIVIRAVMEKTRKHQLVSFPFRDHLRPFASVHLGYEFEQCSSTLPPEQIIVIKERYQRFIIELVDQIQICLPENVEILLLMHGTVQTKHSDGSPETVSFAIHEYVELLEKSVDFCGLFRPRLLNFCFCKTATLARGIIHCLQHYLVTKLDTPDGGTYVADFALLPTGYNHSS
jgi:hypothetical protein